MESKFNAFGPFGLAVGADGTLYLVVDGLYAIRPDGKLRWKFEAGNWITCDPAIGADGTIYIAGDSLYAVSHDGKLKWSLNVGRWIDNPVIGPDGTIYVSGDGLYAVRPDGNLRWKFGVGDWITASPAIGADSTVYFAGGDNSIYAVDQSGRLKWKFETGASVYSSPAIGADGTIYVGSSDGHLYAIESDSKGLARSPWPKFRGTNRNSANLTENVALTEKPINLWPANKADGLVPNELVWMARSGPGRELVFDVYFGTTPTPHW